MTHISRRNFLKLLPLLPLARISWPRIVPASNLLLQGTGKPNILVLVFDTLSAKHMSLFGYSRETTPNIARIAERATVFHNHYAAANFTSPGTASILTGTYPWAHRAFHFHGIVKGDCVNRNVFNFLPPAYTRVAYTHNLLAFSLLHQFRRHVDSLKPTRDLCLYDGQLADLLFFDDYNVAFWSEELILRGHNGPPASMLLSVLDSARSFIESRRETRQHDERYPRGLPTLHSMSFILEDAIDWIRDQALTLPQPFFAYFHLLPPHAPYKTRRDFIDVFMDGWKPTEKESHFSTQGHSQEFLNKQRREYDEYIALVDYEFGRLYDFLEQQNVLENTYLILTSDHGELFERGIHGHSTLTLFEPLLRVPLLISKPGQWEREDVFVNTSCVDLLPTLLNIVGEPIPTWAEGQVLPTFDGYDPDNERIICALEAKQNPARAPLSIATVAMVRDKYKLVHYLGYEKQEAIAELYDLEADPEELSDLYHVKPRIAAELLNRLRDKLEQVNQPFLR